MVRRLTPDGPDATGVKSNDGHADFRQTKVIHYSVSAEPQETTEHKLSGREILGRAGFTPAEDYTSTRDDGNKVIDLDDRESIHVTAVGPPGRTGLRTRHGVYRNALDAFAQGGRPIDDVAGAAKSLAATRQREGTWSHDEWQFRIAAAITAWIWDDEPGARRDV